MPEYEITIPDKGTYRVESPTELTDAQAYQAVAMQAERPDAARQVANDPISRGAKGFAADMPLGDQLVAGYGQGVMNLARGGAQLTGLEKIPAVGRALNLNENYRALDAPLTGTTGGKIGAAAGMLGTLAPLSVAPGAATIGGAGAIGALTGALQPAGSQIERGVQSLLGGFLGAGSQWAGTTGASLLGERVAKQEAAALARQQQNTVRDQTLRAAQKAGYVVPPSAVEPTFLGNRLESLAGKAAVGQEASVRNQITTNKLAREALGLPENAPLTEQSLKDLRRVAGQAYAALDSVPQLNWTHGYMKGLDDIANKYGGASSKVPSLIKPQVTKFVEELKQTTLSGAEANSLIKALRSEGNANLNAAFRSADPGAQALGKAQIAGADLIEDLVTQNLKAQGAKDLIPPLREARKLIAKSYEVERALNVATGDVSAKALGRSLDKGKPLSGELATIGKFAEGFGPYAREGAKVPTPGVSKVEALSSALLGLGGYGVAGPVGVAAAALPLASGPARALLLSPQYQRLLAQPNYSPGLLSQSMIPSPEISGLLMRSTVPAAYFGAQQ